jgi:hypothetical protein
LALFERRGVNRSTLGEVAGDHGGRRQLHLPFTSILAARTNIWGKAGGDVRQLESVKSGASIKVEKAG